MPSAQQPIKQPHLEKRERTEHNKVQKRLRRETGKAIQDYQMIDSDDKVMVCLSGGKDSYTLLDILISLQRSAPVTFEIIAVNLDQQQPDFPAHVLPEYLNKHKIPYKIITEDTYSIVTDIIPENKTYCSLCSRLRRGILYRTASEIGATKIALGHHQDDILETFFLNFFHGGSLKAMPPKLLTDDKAHTVIRPLAYCREQDIAAYAAFKGFPIIPCNLCGSQNNLQRVATKKMLRDWEKRFPGRIQSMFHALQNVKPSHLLDRTLYDFTDLANSQKTAQKTAQAKSKKMPVLNLTE